MNAQIEAAAAALAAAEEALSDAESVYRARADEMALVTQRLTDATNRRIEILAEARAKPDDMPVLGKLALVEQDVADLEHLRLEAEKAAEEAKPDRLEKEVGLAMHRLDQAKAAAGFDAMTEHAARLEEALCKTVAKLHALALATGRPRELSHSWKPSEPLYRAIAYRVVPQ